MTITAYRHDGWPICPSCGADDLRFTRGLPLTPPRQLECLGCKWSGPMVERDK